MKTRRAFAAAAIGALVLCGCGGNSSSSSSGSGGASSSSSTSSSTSGSSSTSSSTSSSSSSTSSSGSCDMSLHTGLTAVQTGVSVDAFDCEILKWTAQNGEPDAMLFKAIIYVESRFDKNAIACPNLPCGTPAGWTAAESGCYGLMQIVPACGGSPNNAGLLANGHPDMAMDMASADWPGSVFNPDVNIEIGIAGVAGNRAQEKAKFAGCTEDQYAMMAIGDYNSYGSTQSCTVYNSAYDDVVLMAYKEYSAAAGWPAHPY